MEKLLKVTARLLWQTPPSTRQAWKFNSNYIIKKYEKKGSVEEILDKVGNYVTL